MTRTTNARLAGLTFLFYIAFGISGMILYSRATSAEGVAAKLARIADHATDVRVVILLSLLGCFAAIVLGVALYGITRDENHELAVLALVCRICEGVFGASNLPKMLGLLWLATAGAGAGAPDVETTNTLGTLLLMPVPSALIGAIFFAVGSMIFSLLMLRGRMIPVSLAWLGVFASVVLVVCLPLQMAGFLTGAMTGYMWIPMLAFEVPLGLWLLIKGVATTPARRTAA